MASVADILFGDKKNKMRSHSSNQSHSKNGQSRDFNHKKPMLSQERISQLLGKKKPSSSYNKNITNKSIHDKSSNSNLIKENPINYSPVQYESYKPKEKSNSILNSTNLIRKQNESTPINSNTLNKIQYKDTREEKLLKNLNNFVDINDVFNELERSKEYSKLFPRSLDEAKNKETFNNDQTRLKSGQYKATNSSEANLFKSIDEINRKSKLDEIKMMGKKQKSESNFNRKNNIYHSKDDIWCSKCKKMHHPDFHKYTPVQVDFKKIFNNSNNSAEVKSRNLLEKEKMKTIFNNNNNNNSKKIEIKNLMQNNNNKISDLNKNKITEIKYQKEISNLNNNSDRKYNPINVNNIIKNKSESIEEKIQKLKLKQNELNIEKKIEERKQQINKIENYNKNSAIYKKNEKYENPIQYKKNTIKSKPKDALFSREDFDEEDDFIVDDDQDMNDYRRHMNKINRGLRRGNYYDDYSDGDLEEAGFDEIQAEEEKTARIGEHEDWIEEMREQQMMDRKKRKYS